MEAILALLGSEASALVESVEKETVEGRPPPFQIQILLTDVVPALLSISGQCCSDVSQNPSVLTLLFSILFDYPECPFLQGRAFVFASNFASFLPPALAGQYLQAAIHVLEAPDANVPVKVSAVKAIRKYV